MRLIQRLLALILFLVVGCTAAPQQQKVVAWMKDDGKFKVLSTTAMINDLVTNVAGDKADTLTLIGDQLDPHSYQLVKGDDEKLARADLIFFNGLNLEHGPSLQEALYSSKKAVSLGDKLFQQNPELFIYHDGQLDPHIWMDISLWAQTLPFIVDALATIDPANRSYYEENGKQYYQTMMASHRQVKQSLQAIDPSKRYLVTSHDAFNYFARAYLADDAERNNDGWKNRFQAPEGLAPESQISSANIKAIIDHLARYRIAVIFPESNVSKDSIKKIVDAGLQRGLPVQIADDVLYGDAMGPDGSDADTYLKMLSRNAQTIGQYLNKNGIEKAPR